MTDTKFYLTGVATLVLLVAIIFAVEVMLCGPDYAAGPRLTGTLTQDANNQAVQVAPTAQLWDNLAKVKTASNLALATNVVTITTSAVHEYEVGQRATVALLTGPALFADVNGTFVIASVPTTTSFTYAFTHPDIITGAATGSTTAYNLSPIVTGTTEETIVFPARAFALIIVPTDATDATFSYTSTGSIGGTFPLTQSVSNVISGTEGDVVYIQRTTTTKLAFQFACGK